MGLFIKVPGWLALSASNVPLAWWAVSPVSLYTSALEEKQKCGMCNRDHDQHQCVLMSRVIQHMCWFKSFFSSQIVQITRFVSTMRSHVQSYSAHVLVQVAFFFTDCSHFMFSPHIVQIAFVLHTLLTLFLFLRTLFSGVGRRGVLHFEFCSNKTPITMIKNEHNKPAHER